MISGLPGWWAIRKTASRHYGIHSRYEATGPGSMRPFATGWDRWLLRATRKRTRVTNSTDPSGEARSHELEISYSRRFAKGLNLNVGYTRLHARQADFFSNEYDASPTWRETNFGAPNRFTATSLVE